MSKYIIIIHFKSKSVYKTLVLSTKIKCSLNDLSKELKESKHIVVKKQNENFISIINTEEFSWVDIAEATDENILFRAKIDLGKGYDEIVLKDILNKIDNDYTILYLLQNNSYV